MATFSSSSSSHELLLPLIPYPQKLSLQGAALRLPPSMYLHVSGRPNPGVREKANRLAEQLAERGLRARVATSMHLEPTQGVLSPSPELGKSITGIIQPLRGMYARPEGYRMQVTEAGVMITAFDEAGFFYAGQTLLQLMGSRSDIPGVLIEDAPILTYRAIHWDFKGWAPTREYLRKCIDKLAHYKFNTLILEYEKFFEYMSQDGLASEDALSTKGLQELSDFAMQRNIRIIPLLPCIGNLGFLLKEGPYQDLREDPRYLQQACPSHPNTIEIYTAMAEDLMAAHTSERFHIGGDGARFLGACPTCQSRAKELGGRSSLYLDYVGRVARYLVSRGKNVLVWDDVLRTMTDEQIAWLPQQMQFMFVNSSGMGGHATQALLKPLERYKSLKRSVWGVACRLPTFRYDGYDNLDAWAEAAELGYLQGLVTTTWTREYSHGPLQSPPEIAWPLTLYAAERSWGGRKITQRNQFLSRFGMNFYGMEDKPQQERLWTVYDLMIREYPREAREVLQDVLPVCKVNRESLMFLDAWLSLEAFDYYLRRFSDTVAGAYQVLQSGEADPFHSGRLRWRVEDLKSKVNELMKNFRGQAARISHEPSAEEYLNCNLAYGLRRLDELGDILSSYPLPEKEWQQPVRL